MFIMMLGLVCQRAYPSCRVVGYLQNKKTDNFQVSVYVKHLRIYGARLGVSAVFSTPKHPKKPRKNAYFFSVWGKF